MSATCKLRCNPLLWGVTKTSMNFFSQPIQIICIWRYFGVTCTNILSFINVNSLRLIAFSLFLGQPSVVGDFPTSYLSKILISSNWKMFLVPHYPTPRHKTYLFLNQRETYVVYNTRALNLKFQNTRSMKGGILQICIVLVIQYQPNHEIVIFL